MNSLLIAQNILQRALRSKKELAGLLLLPVLVLGMMSMVISDTTHNKPSLSLVIQDNGIYGKELAEKLQNLPNFEPVALSPEEYAARTRVSNSGLTVLIPAGFSADIAAGRQVKVSLSGRQDATDLAVLSQAVNQSVPAFYAAAMMGQDLSGSGSKSAAEISASLLQNLDQGSLESSYRLAGPDQTGAQRQALLPILGFAIMFIMVLVFTAMGTILEDKKRLTLARVFALPVKEWEIIAGNLIGSLALGTLQLIPIVFILQHVFAIPWGTGLLELFLIFFCFLIAAIGLGIGLAGIVRDGFNPTLVIATVIVPSSILGGSFIPDSMLPDMVTRLGYAVPQKWVMLAVQKVFSGASLGALIPELGIILVFALAFASFGLKTLRPVDN